MEKPRKSIYFHDAVHLFFFPRPLFFFILKGWIDDSGKQGCIFRMGYFSLLRCISRKFSLFFLNVISSIFLCLREDVRYIIFF